MEKNLRRVDYQSCHLIFYDYTRINALGVVKLFLPKYCNNLLPTKENPFKKHIVVQDPLCPMCGSETKTIGHIL
jgi:hypothetical protein